MQNNTAEDEENILLPVLACKYAGHGPVPFIAMAGKRRYSGSIPACAIACFTEVARKITGTNAVSEIVPTPNHGRITLTAPEAPEYWYQDYGTVQLVNGKAHVNLDPILADIIMVTPDYPVRVFCTPVDMPAFNGVTVTNRTATGFDLVELNGGNHTGMVDYQLVVKPKTGVGGGD